MQIIYAGGCLLVRSAVVHFWGQRLSTFEENRYQLLEATAVNLWEQSASFSDTKEHMEIHASCKLILFRRFRKGYMNF